MPVRIGSRIAVVLFAITMSHTSGAADVVLGLNLVDTGKYGYYFEGTNNHRDVFEVDFESTSSDLKLDLTAYDIDLDDEVRVVLNGEAIGFLTRTANDARGRDQVMIPRSAQNGGTNTLRFEQRVSGYSWGVTYLLLTEAEGGAAAKSASRLLLSLNVAETGKYGYRFVDANDHRDALEVDFDSVSGDLMLDLTTYDIDFDDEVRVFLNGEAIGFLAPTANNGRGRDQIAIPHAAQNGRTNTLRFEQRSPGYRWGVTNLLLAETSDIPYCL